MATWPPESVAGPDELPFSALSFFRFRIFPIAATVLSLAMPAVAQLRVIETPELRLVFVDPTETFLIPYAARTFLNSYAFQRRLFKFDPREPVTVLLTDFSDAGNASATSVPRDSLRIEIAPLSFAFETLAGNERMNIIMNHELVHVATMDQAAKPDRIFRRLFGGKVAPVSDEPESMLVFLPDDATRRGAAVVSRGHRRVRRHVDGRRPRPRAERLRRDGVSLDGAGRHATSTIRSAWCRKARRSTSRSR